MGKRIVALDDDTVKKIAAGEVIERPASAVKELVENSIDARSGRISVEVSGGGRALIKITDNGAGMTREDAEMCFKRYTTSKIRRIEDLDRLRTLGFRGEALASICAVSRVKILTKLEGAIEGTRLVIEAGKVTEVNEIGCPEGTSVEVKDLFFNLPARRKHLKSTRRELAHIVDVVTRYALIRNDIFFSLDHDGTRLLESPPTKGLLDCATNIFGASVSKNLIPLNYNSKVLEISGLVGKPHSARSSAGMQFFYVNGRYVSSRLVSAAVREAYGTLLPKNWYPICVLSINIDPRSVDVNIHPTKQRVKFLYENSVFEAVVSAVSKALKSETLVPDSMPKRLPVRERIPGPKATVARITAVPTTLIPLEKKSSPVHEKAHLPELRVIGDFGETYILAESSKGMVILDQHAAHERILYERLTSQHKDTQELISPIALELSAKEKTVMDDFMEALTELGFNIEPFGGNTYRINSVPVVLGTLVSPEVIRDVLMDMTSLPKSPEKGVEEKGAQIIAKKGATAACRSAIKAGEKQTLERLYRLVRDLYKSSNPFTCPHGRPTMIFITREELEKRFLRT